jgi:hypothetical protein
MTKCPKCLVYYGLKENNYECSKCCSNPKVPPILSSSDDKIQDDQVVNYIQTELNYIPLPDQYFKTIKFCIDKIPLEYIEKILKQFRLEDSKQYVFTDDQACSMIGYSSYNYIFSHFIVKNKLLPWNDMKRGIFHGSSYCYYGNFGEIPKYKSTIRILLKHNIESIIIN